MGAHQSVSSSIFLIIAWSSMHFNVASTLVARESGTVPVEVRREGERERVLSEVSKSATFTLGMSVSEFLLSPYVATAFLDLSTEGKLHDHFRKVESCSERPSRSKRLSEGICQVFWN